MIRSLFSAISGMRVHRTFMDVVGNNIANVNTTGYKGSRVTFEDLISQSYRPAAAPNAQNGGVDPGQVGLGVQVAGTNMVTAAGNLQATQSPTDLAIQGDGYFILRDGNGGQLYTRDGSFALGSGGILTNANGQEVLGWGANAATGQINTNAPLQALTVPVGNQLAAQTSTQVTVAGNLDQRLDATAPLASSKQVLSSVTLYDSMGQAHQATITFTKTDNPSNTWSWQASTTEAGVSISGSGSISFDPTTGAFKDTNGPAPDGVINLTLSNGATSPLAVNVSFAGLTQLAAASQVNSTTDGQPPGSLTSVNIDTSGTVTGIYSNGAKRLVGQVALASFTNPEGLVREGGNNFTTSLNSGAPVVGAAGSGGRGQISSGYLEMSNVDLTQEFSNMILAERGFQANGRVITVSDQMLQELVDLKRQ